MKIKKCDWNKLVDEFLISGLSQADFSRHNQINAKYLSLHLGKRKKNQADYNSESAFIKVKTPKASIAQTSFIVELNFKQTTLKINNPDPTWLASFCQELVR